MDLEKYLKTLLNEKQFFDNILFTFINLDQEKRHIIKNLKEKPMNCKEFSAEIKNHDILI